MEVTEVPLRKIRKDQHMSQETVAAFLDIKTTTYSKIERGIIQLTINRLYDLARLFQLSPEEMLSYGKPVAFSTSADASPTGNITYIPIHAQAGFLNQHTDQRYTDAAWSFSVPTFTDKDLFMISVEGDSMYPTVAPGAFIIIKAVDDINIIKWGEPHVVVTTDGRVIKRVLKHKDASLVTLYSDNTDLYQPYEVPKNSILSLWQLVGMLSKSFALRGEFRGGQGG